MKTVLKGHRGFPIEKYEAHNITILVGRSGTGKTYQVTRDLELDSTKKLLLAQSGDCEDEYLTVSNIKKVPYYDTRWSNSILENFSSLLNLLKVHINNSYDVVILDNVLFDSYNQIAALLKICLQYPNIKFFILLNKLLDLKDEDYISKFLHG